VALIELTGICCQRSDVSERRLHGRRLLLHWRESLNPSK